MILSHQTMFPVFNYVDSSRQRKAHRNLCSYERRKRSKKSRLEQTVKETMPVEALVEMSADSKLKEPDSQTDSLIKRSDSTTMTDLSMQYRSFGRRMCACAKIRNEVKGYRMVRECTKRG